MTVVRATLDSARSGRPTLALLMGEAGIGKTRLADVAAVVARAAGMRVLRGEADSSRREPMDLWQGVFRSLGAYPAGDQYLAAEERRWDHLESLADALTSAAPVLVILEDLHWADSTAVWVLDHLPRMLGEPARATLRRNLDRSTLRRNLDRSTLRHNLDRPKPGKRPRPRLGRRPRPRLGRPRVVPVLTAMRRWQPRPTSTAKWTSMKSRFRLVRASVELLLNQPI